MENGLVGGRGGPIAPEGPQPMPETPFPHPTTASFSNAQTQMGSRIVRVRYESLMAVRYDIRSGIACIKRGNPQRTKIDRKNLFKGGITLNNGREEEEIVGDEKAVKL